MKLDFTPLKHSPGVLNATILVKPNVRVSVSKGSLGREHGWVGEDGDYQAAIQVNDPLVGEIWDLVHLPEGDNVKNHCTDGDIEVLTLFAGGIEPVKNVWVFDTPDKNPPRWLIRFTFTNLPNDERNKLEYAKHIWKEAVKVLPLGVKP